jgi:N-methylhydantoinase B
MHRGGCGSHYEIETLSDAVVSILGDRVDHAPFGVQGGSPAAPNSVELRTGGKTWIPPMRSKAEKIPFAAGDSFHLGSPGGGGFGDPLDRDLAAVEADLNGGFIDAEAAESVYGAVVGSRRMIGDRPVYALDAERSRAKRSGMRPKQRRAG